MHARTLGFAVAMTLSMLAAGCVSGDEGTANVTTSPAMMPPTPKLVYSKELDACPPNAPVQTTSIRDQVTIDDGFDEVLIEYHATGEGQATVTFLNRDDNHVVWGGQQQTVNSAPTTCGDHGEHAAGEVKSIESGEYEVRIQYTGAVAIKFSITARSSHANDTVEHEH